VISVRWVQTFTRLAALMVALLVGADDAEVRVVDGMRLVHGWRLSDVAFGSLVTAAAAETAITRQAQIDPTTGAPDSPAYPGGSLTGLFRGGGLLGGFAAGFLGSGVLGLLFGRGLFGELDGPASYFGLLCQLALLMTLCWLIWTRWNGGDAAEPGARSPRQLADAYLRSRDDLHPGPAASIDDVIESDRKQQAPSSAFTETHSDCG
jgi:predicted lipid-binding transport protein (Tim44 family)